MRTIVVAGVGCFLAIYLLSFATDRLTLELLAGSFGSSAVLIFGFPDSPFSHPKNVVVGHFLSSLIGLLCLTFLGATGFSVALAVGASAAVMLLTGKIHPPAGSNPVIIFLLKPTWHFLLFPTLFGSIGLVLIAIFYNNMTGSEKYPKEW